MSNLNTDEIRKKIPEWNGKIRDRKVSIDVYYSIRVDLIETLNEIDQLREELQMVRRDQKNLSDSQIDVVETIESLEKDILQKCKAARSLILFNEHPKSVEQRIRNAIWAKIQKDAGNTLYVSLKQAREAIESAEVK